MIHSVFFGPRGRVDHLQLSQMRLSRICCGFVQFILETLPVPVVIACWIFFFSFAYQNGTNGFKTPRQLPASPFFMSIYSQIF